jgi:hypothetical protein
MKMKISEQAASMMTRRSQTALAAPRRLAGAREDALHVIERISRKRRSALISSAKPASKPIGEKYVSRRIMLAGENRQRARRQAGMAVASDVTLRGGCRLLSWRQNGAHINIEWNMYNGEKRRNGLKKTQQNAESAYLSKHEEGRHK